MFRSVLDAVVDAIVTIVCGRRWGKAFASNGFGSTKFCLGSSLLKKLGLASLPGLMDVVPDLEQFKVIFPERRWMDFHLLLGPLEAMAASSGSGAGTRATRPASRLSSKTCLADIA